MVSNAAVTEISIPYPEASDLMLRLGVGALRLKIVPGEGDLWVSGTYRDPTNSIPLRVAQEGSTARITQEVVWGDVFARFGSPPTLELALGKGRPFAITMETGASEDDIDLGGVPVSRLVAKHGAGRLKLNFSRPNPQAMSLLSLSAGAGEMVMTNLANANFAELLAEGGAAAYRFDFGGTLSRDAHARIQAGVCSVHLTIPRTTAAKITNESLIGGLAVGDGFTKRQGAFWTSAALAGETPVLSVRITLALGSLNLDVV